MKIKGTQKMIARTVLFFIASSSVFWLSCSDDKVTPTDPDEEEPTETPAGPVETKPGNGAGFEPAFEGQTRINGVKTTTPIAVTLLLEDEALYKPWSFEFISNNQILLLQKDGVMRILTLSGNTVSVGPEISGVSEVFFDTREITGGANSSNAGLFDVALDPDFEHSHLIFFTYSAGDIQSNRLVVARANLLPEENRLGNVKEIYRATPDIQYTSVYGGRVLFDQAGYLYVSVGERHQNNSRFQAQNLDSSLGKILRLTKDGAPAPDNPFAATPNALSEIWAYGIRSPLGLEFHPATGALWLGESGPKGGDELNIIERGKNYGWPIISYGIMYDDTPVGQGIHPIPGTNPVKYEYKADDLTGGGITAKDGMEQPRYYWDPAIAPGGMAFYDSDVIPEWKNNLFVSSLVQKHLIRIVIEGEKIVGEERLMADLNLRIRDVRVGPDGALYVITDTQAGRIYRIGKR